MVFCGNQYKGAGFPGTSTYHKLRTGQRPWPTKEIPCVIRPSGQCAKPGRSSGCPMGTGNSYGRLQRPNPGAKVYHACRVLPKGWEPELRKTRGSCLVICPQIRGWDHQIFCIQCTGSYLVYLAGSGSNAALAD